jgi:hypothetical protein
LREKQEAREKIGGKWKSRLGSSFGCKASSIRIKVISLVFIID